MNFEKVPFLHRILNPCRERIWSVRSSERRLSYSTTPAVRPLLSAIFCYLIKHCFPESHQRVCFVANIQVSRLHLQSARMSQARNYREGNCHVSRWFLVCFILRPPRWRRHIPLKRLLTWLPEFDTWSCERELPTVRARKTVIKEIWVLRLFANVIPHFSFWIWPKEPLLMVSIPNSYSAAPVLGSMLGYCVLFSYSLSDPGGKW